MNIKIMIITALFFYGVFLVLRLWQFLNNIRKKPYVVLNDEDPNQATVYMWLSSAKLTIPSDYQEYKFQRIDGKWKFVIEKKDFICIIVVCVISFFIFGAVSLIKGSSFLQTCLIASLVFLLIHADVVATNYDAYRVLMKYLRKNK